MGKQRVILLITDEGEDASEIIHAIPETKVTVWAEKEKSIEKFVNLFDKQRFNAVIISFLSQSFDINEIVITVKKYDFTIPFIIISKSHSEDIVLQSIKKAFEIDNFIIKDEIPMLGTILEKEFEKAEIKHEHFANLPKLIEHKNLLYSILQHTSDGVCLFQNDFKIVFMNNAAFDFLQIEQQNFSEISLKGLFDVKIYKIITEKFATMELNGILAVEEKITMLDGNSFPALIRFQRLSGDVWLMLFHSITKFVQAEIDLLESKERYDLAARSSNDGLWDWNLKHVEMYFSPRWKTILGYNNDEISASPDEWFDRVHPNDIEKLKFDFVSHFHGRTERFINEHRIQIKDGSYLWVIAKGLALRNEQGKALRMAGSLTDIHERKLAEERLHHDTFHDTLTKLPNRNLLLDRLKQATIRAQRKEEYVFAILHLDLDRFNIINESLGHKLADNLLIKVADIIWNCIRTGDTLARLGGDEFIILLDDLKDSSETTFVAERILKHLKKPISVDGQKIYITASIGITISKQHYEYSEMYLRDAGVAMHRAKKEGGNRYIIFDERMHARAMKLLELESDLRKAIENEEFELYYQPVVNLNDCRIIGFEALIRWQHPTRGLIQPADFIEFAEKTGLIIPIDRWVVTNACKQLQIWQEEFIFQPPISLNVNLSSKHFSKPELVGFIKNLLKKYKIQPRSLKIEITESALMDNVDFSTFVLVQLKSLGVQVHIDDFGTGYSSLSYLHHFPIDTLKIDRSFVSSLGTEKTNTTIVSTVIMLAKSLGMEVLAEGVASKGHVELLKQMSCEYGQGFYFSKPLSKVKAEKLLRNPPPWL